MILDWKGCEMGERQERQCTLVHAQQRGRNRAMLQHREMRGWGWKEERAVCCLEVTTSWPLSHGAGHEPFLTQRGDHPEVSLHCSHPVALQERQEEWACTPRVSPIHI